MLRVLIRSATYISFKDISLRLGYLFEAPRLLGGFNDDLHNICFSRRNTQKYQQVADKGSHELLVHVSVNIHKIPT